MNISNPTKPIPLLLELDMIWFHDFLSIIVAMIICLFDITHSLGKASFLVLFCLLNSHSCPGNHIPLNRLVVKFLFRLNLLVSILVCQEKKVHGFQVQIRSFRVEAIDNKCRDKVENGENDIGLVANILESWRCDFNDLNQYHG